MEENYSKYSVIVPVRKYNKMLKKCILEILNLSKKIEIIIVYDDKNFLNEIDRDFKIYIDKQIKVILSQKYTISSKRNLGVKKSNRQFVAFIDSDAFPSSTWIANANKILEKNKKIYCVGGPNISPKEQNFFNEVVGNAQKSFLVTGKWSYHKKKGKNSFVSHTPSCNMIVRKDIYSKFNGMNEDIYTGEDLDFCTRINDNGFRIYFDSNVIVYHYDRSIKNYFLQKIFRGSAIVEVKQNFISKLYLSIPLFFLLFNAIGIFCLMFDFSSIFIVSYLLVMALYSIICIYETCRYAKSKNFLIVFLLIFFGNYLIGLGNLMKLLRFEINNNLYQND